MSREEHAYDRRRMHQWSAGQARAEGVSRRDLLRPATAAGVVAVSAEPLHSPWDTDFYRLFGAAYPPGGSDPLVSGAGGIRRGEVSTDAGAGWQSARLHDEPRTHSWSRWSADWHPTAPGPTALPARATDTAGRRQPDRTTANDQGYLFDAVVHHPVTVHA